MPDHAHKAWAVAFHQFERADAAHLRDVGVTQLVHIHGCLHQTCTSSPEKLHASSRASATHTARVASISSNARLSLSPCGRSAGDRSLGPYHACEAVLACSASLWCNHDSGFHRILMNHSEQPGIYHDQCREYLPESSMRARNRICRTAWPAASGEERATLMKDRTWLGQSRSQRVSVASCHHASGNPFQRGCAWHPVEC